MSYRVRKSILGSLMSGEVMSGEVMVKIMNALGWRRLTTSPRSQSFNGRINVSTIS
jgi:hypothetical protein